ncbi:MAG: FAD-dependent oxidoreductase [Oscillospiraceae bacterium]|jgi:NADPH-dependent 2,4-dienoyl-CoA reductase/sulfur reductase-like enzyme/Pyruvate/2-oxoacid:ferredoxin oxidoreductase delta subunit|nr:FAD-dependent oxidoreductase [Oscillospiraceae bacterium]
MKRYDLIIIGAGPAGLSAAAEAASLGMSVAVFDENARPGGQLFKQIHKFFGSKEHKAKMRGFDIGGELLRDARALGVEVYLNAPVFGLYAGKEIVARLGERAERFKGDAVIVAAGATENMLTFDGWTLPGVMGAGAAQTMMNINRVKPGERVLMLGSGNVGLVVGFQILQAGCELAAVVDAAPRIGGYGVHAAKLARTGVPFYLSHTVIKAEGERFVTGVTIAGVDKAWQPIPGSEKRFDVDAICIAVGLSPSTQLLKMAGCEMSEPAPGAGYLPVCDKTGETSVPGIYAAGDVSGIEEASSAMLEGRISGAATAGKLGFISQSGFKLRFDELEGALGALHEGMFAPKNRGKLFTETDEGISVSVNLLEKGFLADGEAEAYPGVSAADGVHPVIECTQNIPCDPCQDSCPRSCIRVPDRIVALPVFDGSAGCIGCGQCVAACSGQSIFLVNEDIGGGLASVTIPYELTPLPQKGDAGVAYDRSGAPVCAAEIIGVKTAKAFDRTCLLTFSVPRELGMRARFWKKETM